MPHETDDPRPTRVHCIQHSDRVRPQGVVRWAAQRGVDLVVTRIDRAPLPPIDEVTRVIVLGGKMNTDDVAEYPWLDDERRWLGELVANPDVHMVGICLGSQLIAEVLGGSVTRATKREIGWHTLDRTAAGAASHVFGALPDRFDVFEWHGDTWTLPPGAELTATGSVCVNQAFSWRDRVHGVQFHPEFEYDRMRYMAATTSDDLTTGGAVQTAESFLARPERFDENATLLDTLLDRALLATPEPSQ